MFKDISGPLSKFSKLSPPEGAIKKAFIDIVFDELGVDLDPKDISVKKNTIFFTGSAVLKSEVFLNKSSILLRLAKKLGTEHRSIQDIR